VPFCGSFSVRLAVLPLQGFEVTHLFFDDLANTVARCLSPLGAKFNLFGSENATWQIWLRIEIG